MISSVLQRICRGAAGKTTQVFMAIMITIPTTSLGMMFGWISPTLQVLQSPAGPLRSPLTEGTVSWMASVTFIVSFGCEFVFGFLADRIGRKWCLMITTLSLTICWAIKLACPFPWALVLARGIAGVGCAGCFVITPLYIKEISSSEIRGALGSLLILSQNLGYLLIYIIGDLVEYKLMMWVCFLIPAAHLVAFLLMPESPSYLIKKGNIEDAASVLAWLRCKDSKDKSIAEELHQLQMEEKLNESGKKESLLNIVRNPTTFKAFRISLVVMLAHELCGYMVVLMYASVIFERAAATGESVDLSANKQAIVLGVVQLVGSIVASSIVEKTGRKWLLAVTSFGTGASMVVLGAWFYMSAKSVYLPGWLPVLALATTIFWDAAGFQSVPYVIMSEMFSFRFRGVVTSVQVAACSLTIFIQMKTFDPLIKLVGIHTTFYLFASLCFLGTVYTIFCVPETRNKTLDEIYKEIGGHDQSNDSSSRDGKA